MDVNILSINTSNELSLSSTISPKRTTGLQKLIQQVVKILLTSPGTDMWNLGIGGGLKSIVSRSTSRDNIGTMQGEIAIVVMNTERYLLDEQIGVDLDTDSRLKHLKLSRVFFDRALERWNIIIDLETISGKTDSINIA